MRSVPCVAACRATLGENCPRALELVVGVASRDAGAWHGAYRSWEEILQTQKLLEVTSSPLFASCTFDEAHKDAQDLEDAAATGDVSKVKVGTLLAMNRDQRSVDVGLVQGQ